MPKAAQIRGKIHSPILPANWAIVSDPWGGGNDPGQASSVACEGGSLVCPGAHGTGSSVRAGARPVFTPASQRIVEPVLTQRAVNDISLIKG